LSYNFACHGPYLRDITLRRGPTVFIHVRGTGLIPAGDVAKALDGEDVVSETTDGAAGHQGGERKRSMGWFALVGFARGLALPVMVGGPILLLGADATSFPLATFVIVNPLICAGLGCLFHRFPEERLRLPSSFFAVEPLSVLERLERSRRVSRYVWAGFAIGIVTALGVSSLEVACHGWPYLLIRTNDRAANDQKTRADKYRKAAQEPWAPVGRDPMEK
jgi:hypothetical protein